LTTISRDNIENANLTLLLREIKTLAATTLYLTSFELEISKLRFNNSIISLIFLFHLGAVQNVRKTARTHYFRHTSAQLLGVPIGGSEMLWRTVSRQNRHMDAGAVVLAAR
jgi:hypothetical protein